MARCALGSRRTKKSGGTAKRRGKGDGLRYPTNAEILQAWRNYWDNPPPLKQMQYDPPPPFLEKKK